MNSTVTSVITWTFVVIILIWILVKYQAFDAIVGQMGQTYTGAIKALLPTQT